MVLFTLLRGSTITAYRRFSFDSSPDSRPLSLVWKASVSALLPEREKWTADALEILVPNAAQEPDREDKVPKSFNEQPVGQVLNATFPALATLYHKRGISLDTAMAMSNVTNEEISARLRVTSPTAPTL